MKKHDEKYVDEIRERLADSAWEFILAGSKDKAKQALANLAKQLSEYRHLFLERKWIVLDKDLIPVSKWPKELKETLKEKLGIEES